MVLSDLWGRKGDAPPDPRSWGSVPPGTHCSNNGQASTTTFGLALIAFALSRLVVLSLIILVVVGCGTTLYMGAINTMLQSNVPDDFRGRIMSVYNLILGGFMPLGGMVLGSAASLTGSVSTVVATGGAVLALSALAVGGVVPPLRRLN